MDRGWTDCYLQTVICNLLFHSLPPLLPSFDLEEHSSKKMQCADLLDQHVGSIAELKKQTDIAVVPPGLR